jgi:hypothetical protein
MITQSSHLTLFSNGTYIAQHQLDIGDAGSSGGTWSLVATQLVLSPSNEASAMAGRLHRFDVYRYNTNWVFVAEGDRQSYERIGIYKTMNNYQREEDIKE